MGFTIAKIPEKISDQNIVLLNFLIANKDNEFLFKGNSKEILTRYQLEKNKTPTRLRSLEDAALISRYEHFDLGTLRNQTHWKLNPKSLITIQSLHNDLTLCLWKFIYHAKVSIGEMQLTRKNIATLCYLVTVANTEFEVHEISTTKIRNALGFTNAQTKGQIRKLSETGLLLQLSTGRAAGGIFGKWKSTYLLNRSLIKKICEDLAPHHALIDKGERFSIELPTMPFQRHVLPVLGGNELRFTLKNMGANFPDPPAYCDDLNQRSSCEPVFTRKPAHFRKREAVICSMIIAKLAREIHNSTNLALSDPNEGNLKLDVRQYRERILATDELISACIETFHSFLSTNALNRQNLVLEERTSESPSIEFEHNKLVDFGFRGDTEEINSHEASSDTVRPDQNLNLFANMLLDIAITWAFQLSQFIQLKHDQHIWLTVDEYNDKVLVITQPQNETTAQK